MALLMLIVEIIVNLIKLFVMLRSPEDADMYISKVNAIVADAHKAGEPTFKHIHELLEIRDEIKAKYAA